MSDIRIVPQQAFRDGKYSNEDGGDGVSLIGLASNRFSPESLVEGAVPAPGFRDESVDDTEVVPVKRKPGRPKKVSNV